MKKYILLLGFIFIMVFGVPYSKAEDVNQKASLDFILTACGGSNSAKEKQKISSNLTKLLKSDSDDTSGQHEKSSEQLGISMIFSGFEDEDKKAKAMEFFPACIQKMMLSMKDFLSEEQKTILSKVIKVTKVESNSNSSKVNSGKNKVAIFVPNKSKTDAINFFESTECHNISELEKADSAVVADGTAYCDSENRMVLSFHIDKRKGIYDLLNSRSSGLVETHHQHRINALGIKTIKFSNGEIRYFQLPYPVKEDKNGLNFVQINFVPKPIKSK